MSRMGKRVRVSTRHPRAAAVCDRCGLWANHTDLVEQFRYAGGRRAPTNLLVHRHCLDALNPQLRTRTLPPDGQPIRNPRPEPYTADFARVLTDETGLGITDETGAPININDVFP